MPSFGIVVVEPYEFESLLRGACANAPWAWEQLYRAYAPRLLGYLRLRGPDAAEDVLGEVFLDVVRQVHGFEGPEPAFVAWLFRIAHNRSVDEHRRRSRRPESPTEHVPDQADRDTADIVLEGVGAERVEALLAALPEDQRRVVYLRTLLDLSFADVAGVMDRSEGSVKMLHGRAMKSLAPRLRPAAEGSRP